MVTFPRNHPVREYTIKNINTCYCSPYIHAIWSEYNDPFIQLKDILDVPVYNWESEFIEPDTYNCMAHIRVINGAKASRIDEYYDKFWEHLTVNMPYLANKAGPIDRSQSVKNIGEKGEPGIV